MDTTNYKISNQWIFIWCIVFAFLLYGNTLRNKYCLDDAIVITKNKFTQKGINGIRDIFANESFTGFFGKRKELVAGARYRPLSIATFALEKEFFGKNPFISHFINIVLYGLTAFLLYLVLTYIFRNDNRKFFVPVLAGVLFLFHPIHTEVVANIKGRDEILALLFSLLACYLVLVNKDKVILLVLAGLSWFLALLSKENAYAFIIIMPLLLYTAGIRSFKQYVKPFISFVIAGGFFLILRQIIIGGSFTSESTELLNNSFLDATTHQKYATIFYTLGKYVRLLVFPHPLTYDYYPYHIQLIGWNNILSILSLVFYLALVIVFFILLKKRRAELSVSIAFYLIPLIPVINIFYPIGTFMNERFLYFSSIGFCLVFGIILYYLYIGYSKLRVILVSAVSIILCLYAYKTISRNVAWYNDYTLFTTDVKTSFNSAKSNCSAGGILLESTDTIINEERKRQTIRKSIEYLKKSIEIHPKYIDAWLLLGNAYVNLGDNPDSAVFCYTNILNLSPNHTLALSNLSVVAEKIKDIDSRMHIYNKILQHDSLSFLANYKLGKIYGQYKNDLDKATWYFKKALIINPGSKDVYIDMGVAYGLKKDFNASAEMLEKAYKLDKNDANVCINLGLTYQLMGNIVKARELFAKGDSLRKNK